MSTEYWLINIIIDERMDIGMKVRPKSKYADDFVVTATSREDIEAILPKIEQWLAERGLQLNKEKTRIVHINEGFNFLGFNLRQYNGKLLIKPQKEKVLQFLQEIRDWLKENKVGKVYLMVKPSKLTT